MLSSHPLHPAGDGGCLPPPDNRLRFSHGYQKKAALSSQQSVVLVHPDTALPDFVELDAQSLKKFTISD